MDMVRLDVRYSAQDGPFDSVHVMQQERWDRGRTCASVKPLHEIHRHQSHAPALSDADVRRCAVSQREILPQS